MEELIKLIKEQATFKTYNELDEEYAPGNSGNFNDAYQDGEDDGWINCCRWLIRKCNL